MDGPKFWIPKNVLFRHICGAFSFWSNFGWPKIWVIPCWVTTPHGCHWPQLTNSGCQFQQWTLFTFKQYCLEGILAKESSPRTKDILLWRDLQVSNFGNHRHRQSVNNRFPAGGKCFQNVLQNDITVRMPYIYVGLEGHIIYRCAFRGEGRDLSLKRIQLPVLHLLSCAFFDKKIPQRQDNLS